MTRAIISTLLALLLFAVPGRSRTPQQLTTAPPDPKSPVGHWIADHPDHSTSLVLWWNFHPDGTLTLNAGGIADGPYHLAGNTLTLPPAEPGAAPGVFDIRFSNGKLYITARTEHAPTLEFTRIGAPTSSESPIIGAWRITSAPHATDSEQETLRSHMMDMITVYQADGIYHARMPIQTFIGRWNAATQTYKVNNYPPLRYERRGADLLLNIPPDGKDQHLYHPDPVQLP